MRHAGTTSLWQPLRDELSLWQDAGGVARLWLRDDDVVAVTPALERLTALSRRYAAPILMASIPASAGDELGPYFAAAPLLAPAVHGFAHRNHARPGDKTQEFPPDRGAATIRDEIGRGRARLAALFGARLTPIYVPPWNRIAPEVAALLPVLGFRALSTFGSRQLSAAGSPLAELNTHVDIIHWKADRAGRDHGWLVRELALELGIARAAGRPHVGILGHHLVHDETAWSFLDALLEATSDHPAVVWTSAIALLDGPAGAPRSAGGA